MTNNNPGDNEDEVPGIHLSDQDVEAYRQIHNVARNQADVDETMRMRPINMRSREDMMFHMMTAHDVIDHLSLQFYDEGEHSHIPALRNRKRDWSGETVPKLDEQDIRNWHQHEHTASEYASDYPHTTMGDEHFHH